MNFFLSKNNYVNSLIKEIISNLSKSILTSFIFSKFTPLALNFLNGLYTLNMALQIKLIICTLVLVILLLIIYKVYSYYLKLRKNKKNKKKKQNSTINLSSFSSSSEDLDLNKVKKNTNEKSLESELNKVKKNIKAKSSKSLKSEDNKKKLSYEALLSSSK